MALAEELIADDFLILNPKACIFAYEKKSRVNLVVIVDASSTPARDALPEIRIL
jgi:hypothetical protein